MELKDKVALISGGGTGIGRSIALALAGEGVHICFNHPSEEPEIPDTLRELGSLGVRGKCYLADVTDERAVQGLVESVLEDFGRIDILANSAGVTKFIPHENLEEMTGELFDRILRVNIEGVFFMFRACAGEIRKNEGCVINIGSTAGFTGRGSCIAYAASKAAVINMTKSFARVLAPEARANCICPGVVRTRFIKGQEEFEERYREATPLKKLGTPEDVADAAMSFIKYGDHVTGQFLTVDGGESINY